MSCVRSLCMVLLVLDTLPCIAKSPQRGDVESRKPCGPDCRESQGIAERRVKILVDSGTWQCWRNGRNQDHPSWPARLVRIPDDTCFSSQSMHDPGIKCQKMERLRRQSTIVRAGDVLTVSDETTALLASFEGVALSSGFRGAVIGVRLRFGGKIMHARVMAPGKVRLIADALEAR